MFDETRYGRPQIEDVELGYRMHDKGHRLLLDPSILGTHQKRWTLRSMIRSDFSHRGVPWTHLLLERGELLGGQSLSVGTGDKFSAALVGALAVCLVMLVIYRNLLMVALTVLCLAFLVMLNRDLIAWYARKRGPLFAAGAFGMHLIYHATNVASVAYGSATHFLGSSGTSPRPVHR